MLSDAYGGEAMKKYSVFEWHKLFKEVHENVEDEGRSGRPRTHRTDENVGRVQNLILIRAVSVQPNIDKKQWKIPELWPNEWILPHDNAAAHMALSVDVK